MNMMFRLTSAIAALTMTCASYAAVSIQVPEEIKVVSVNQQEVKSSILRANSEYKLDAGTHLIGVRYQEFFQHYDNSHDILKSSVVHLQTSQLEDGQKYRLALIDAPKDFDTAQKYKDQPMIGLYNQNGQLVAQQTGVSQAAQPLLGKTLGNSTIDLTTKPVVATPGAISAVQTKATVPVEVELKNQVANHVVIGVDAELKQLWQKANKQERQKFMSWLAEQAN